MTNFEKENEIQNKIYSCISAKESYLFKAGAGAGKTYALVKSLEYIINENYINKSQKVICITYTNNAVEEIRTRLFDSEECIIGTLHETLWAICSPYQTELKKEHLKKIEFEISRLQESIDEYNHQNKTEILNIEKCVETYSDSNFFKLTKAKDFKSYFEPKLDIKIRNFANFKSYISIQNKQQQLRKYITENSIDDSIIKYDTSSVTDRLTYNKISHDTMISYCSSIIKSNSTLQKIIVDRFPYILVDECQDTLKELVEIFSLLDNVFTDKICIGYYGDFKQKIYETGVGEELESIHSDLKIINKIFNRRSKSEIINLANKFVKNNDEEQVSIFEDNTGASVKWHTTLDDTYYNIINENRGTHTILYLTNSEIYDELQINDIIAFFKDKNSCYNGNKYKLLNQETLSGIEKLGKIQSLMYDIIKPFTLQNSDLLSTIFSKKTFISHSISEIRNSLEYMRDFNPSNMNSIISFYDTEEDALFFKELKEKYGEYTDTNSFLLESIMNIFKVDSEVAEEIFNKFLQIEYNEFYRWYKYLEDKKNNEAQIYTLHGAKGLEFENVILVIKDSFGHIKNSNNIKTCLVSIYDTQVIEYDQEIMNLLYVAITRAKQNLIIIYKTENKESWMINFTN